MSKRPDETTVQKLATSAGLVIISRISAPLMLGLVGWALHTLNEMQTSVSTLSASLPLHIATVNAKIEGDESRISTLENWRNSMEAFAGEDQPKKKKGGL